MCGVIAIPARLDKSVEQVGRTVVRFWRKHACRRSQANNRYGFFETGNVKVLYDSFRSICLRLYLSESLVSLLDVEPFESQAVPALSANRNRSIIGRERCELLGDVSREGVEPHRHLLSRGGPAVASCLPWRTRPGSGVAKALHPIFLLRLPPVRRVARLSPALSMGNYQ